MVMCRVMFRILMAALMFGCAETDSFTAPIGDVCDADIPLCAGGSGYCIAGTCRAQCSGYPHCAPDLAVCRDGDDSTGRRCWCE
jgi:hypothetical protein